MTGSHGYYSAAELAMPAIRILDKDLTDEEVAALTVVLFARHGRSVSRTTSPIAPLLGTPGPLRRLP